MNRFRNYVVVAIGIGSISFVLSITSAGPALAAAVKPLFVEVVNTTPIPVRDQDLSAIRVPFAVSVSLTVSSGELNGGGVLDLSTVLPPGRGFVIDHLSANIFMPPGHQAALTVLAALPSSATPDIKFDHFFVLEPQGSLGGGANVFVASTPFRAFVDGRMSISAGLLRLSSNSSGEGFGRIDISGYLVECGAPRWTPKTGH